MNDAVAGLSSAAGWPGGCVVSRGGPGALAERGRGVMEASWLSVLRFLLWRFL